MWDFEEKHQLPSLSAPLLPPVATLTLQTTSVFNTKCVWLSLLCFFSCPFKNDFICQPIIYLNSFIFHSFERKPQAPFQSKISLKCSNTTSWAPLMKLGNKINLDFHLIDQCTCEGEGSNPLTKEKKKNHIHERCINFADPNWSLRESSALKNQEMFWKGLCLGALHCWMGMGGTVISLVETQVRVLEGRGFTP